MGKLESVRLTVLERLLRILRALGSRLGVRRGLAPHLLTGTAGETTAYFHLRRQGYTVTARRWQLPGCPGDLDLVAWQGPVLCIVEVKTRTAHDAIPAQETVDEEKRQTLRRLARQYLRRLPGETEPVLRFDILAVYLLPKGKTEFEHFQGAFGWSEREPWDRWGDRE